MNSKVFPKRSCRSLRSSFESKFASKRQCQLFLVVFGFDNCEDTFKFNKVIRKHQFFQLTENWAASQYASSSIPSVVARQVQGFSRWPTIRCQVPFWHYSLASSVFHAVDSGPFHFTICAVQCSAPKGVPRVKLRANGCLQFAFDNSSTRTNRPLRFKPKHASPLETVLGTLFLSALRSDSKYGD